MKVLVNLEPIELKFIPELFTLLVHDVADALVTVLFLLDILLLLFLIIVIW